MFCDPLKAGDLIKPEAPVSDSKPWNLPKPDIELATLNGHPRLKAYFRAYHAAYQPPKITLNSTARSHQDYPKV